MITVATYAGKKKGGAYSNNIVTINIDAISIVTFLSD